MGVSCQGLGIHFMGMTFFMGIVRRQGLVVKVNPTIQQFKRIPSESQ